eukprot:m.770203 g.770203  ORF g.770203 m.770203 type:complete len:120 (+) comp23240_c0_seq2:1761-2120(+)
MVHSRSWLCDALPPQESEIDDDELRVQLDEMLDEFDAMDIEDEDAAEGMVSKCLAAFSVWAIHGLRENTVPNFTWRFLKLVLLSLSKQTLHLHPCCSARGGGAPIANVATWILTCMRTL